MIEMGYALYLKSSWYHHTLIGIIIIVRKHSYKNISAQYIIVVLKLNAKYQPIMSLYRIIMFESQYD